MRIIWIGPFPDGTGYAAASQLHIRALAKTGAQLACRPIKFNDKTGSVHPLVQQLCAASLTEADVVVQHTLPQTFTHVGPITNIGLFYQEVDPLPPTWANKCRAMDAVLTTKDIPVPCDMDRYARGYIAPREAAELKDHGFFVFYTVCELTRRKNIEGLLRAFYGEFRPDEPVRLLVKCSLPEGGREAAERAVGDECRTARNLMGLAADDYRVGTVGRWMKDDEIMGLHAWCDAYVAPSFGEGWNLPAFDAMAMGRTPIVTATGGHLQWLTDDTGWLVPGRPEPAYGMGPGNWTSPCPLELRRAMRAAYEDRGLAAAKAANGLDQADRFNLAKAGQLTLEVLQHHVTKIEGTRTGIPQLAGSQGPNGYRGVERPEKPEAPHRATQAVFGCY